MVILIRPLYYLKWQHIMEWMLNNQDARRNLTPAERLVAAEKLREKIAEEAKEKQKKDSKKFYGNQHKSVDSTPCGEQSKNINKAKVHTDKEIAKIAGVGTGTVARFNTIMKSNDEELKNKVITGEKKIGTA